MKLISLLLLFLTANAFAAPAIGTRAKLFVSHLAHPDLNYYEEYQVLSRDNENRQSNVQFTRMVPGQTEIKQIEMMDDEIFEPSVLTGCAAVKGVVEKVTVRA